ncbi:PREDICTED: uncharacterized protein LOC109125403 [Camelina sativa]|uniref:Uncharacterized protein LOC109125403 n=1 Tax=Camelina sativa TaxID=90675 RepID=A0ABM1Q720_CAMSA|nr:PREDICTED: uncharacterized protein LOC109125403 [Camelina sativa]
MYRRENAIQQIYFAARFCSATVLNHRLRGNFIRPSSD